MIKTCLDRLEETIDLETTALLARDFSGLDAFSRRKSQALLELNRLDRTMAGSLSAHVEFSHLSRLREKMEHNLRILSNQMRAAQEIAALISTAIVNSESDGTYSPPLQMAGASA